MKADPVLFTEQVEKPAHEGGASGRGYGARRLQLRRDFREPLFLRLHGGRERSSLRRSGGRSPQLRAQASSQSIEGVFDRLLLGLERHGVLRVLVVVLAINGEGGQPG